MRVTMMACCSAASSSPMFRFSSESRKLRVKGITAHLLQNPCDWSPTAGSELPTTKLPATVLKKKGRSYGCRACSKSLPVITFFTDSASRSSFVREFANHIIEAACQHRPAVRHTEIVRWYRRHGPARETIAQHRHERRLSVVARPMQNQCEPAHPRPADSARPCVLQNQLDLGFPLAR